MKRPGAVKPRPVEKLAVKALGQVPLLRLSGARNGSKNAQCSRYVRLDILHAQAQFGGHFGIT